MSQKPGGVRVAMCWSDGGATTSDLAEEAAGVETGNDSVHFRDCPQQRAHVASGKKLANDAAKRPTR